MRSLESLNGGQFKALDDTTDNPDKPALSGTWAHKGGELKIEFCDKKVLKVSAHNGALVIKCEYTVGKEGLVKAKVTEDRVYRFWDRWICEGEYPHLFVIDLETKAITDLTPETRHWFDFMEPSGQYDVSPDGREIVFSASATGRIIALNAADGKQLWEYQATPKLYVFSDPVPGEGRVYVTGMDGSVTALRVK